MTRFILIALLIAPVAQAELIDTKITRNGTGSSGRDVRYTEPKIKRASGADWITGTRYTETKIKRETRPVGVVMHNDCKHIEKLRGISGGPRRQNDFLRDANNETTLAQRDGLGPKKNTGGLGRSVGVDISYIWGRDLGPWGGKNRDGLRRQHDFFHGSDPVIVAVDVSGMRSAPSDPVLPAVIEKL